MVVPGEYLGSWVGIYAVVRGTEAHEYSRPREAASGTIHSRQPGVLRRSSVLFWGWLEKQVSNP